MHSLQLHTTSIANSLSCTNRHKHSHKHIGNVFMPHQSRYSHAYMNSRTKTWTMRTLQRSTIPLYSPPRTNSHINRRTEQHAYHIDGEFSERRQCVPFDARKNERKGACGGHYSRVCGTMMRRLRLRGSIRGRRGRRRDIGGSGRGSRRNGIRGIRGARRRRRRHHEFGFRARLVGVRGMKR